MWDLKSDKDNWRLADELKKMLRTLPTDRAGYCLEKPQGVNGPDWERTLRKHVRAVELVTLGEVDAEEPLVMMTGNWQLASDFAVLKDALYKPGGSDVLLAERIAPAIALFEHRHQVSVLRGEFHVRDHGIGMSTHSDRKNLGTRDAMTLMPRWTYHVHDERERRKAKQPKTPDGAQRALVSIESSTKGHDAEAYNNSVVAGDMDPACSFPAVRRRGPFDRRCCTIPPPEVARGIVTVDEKGKEGSQRAFAHCSARRRGLIPAQADFVRMRRHRVQERPRVRRASCRRLVPDVVFDAKFDSLWTQEIHG